MKLLVFLSICVILLTLLLFIEVYIGRNGKVEPYITPQKDVMKFGTNGKNLDYLVIGDSTAAGQGAAYTEGIAVKTAEHLGESYQVHMLNVAVSGARAKDIEEQFKKISTFTPDIILLAVGANDVTHLTRKTDLQRELDTVIQKMINKNCDVKIVLTASPDMGTPPRLLPPLSYLASVRSRQVNTFIEEVITKHQLTFAHIYDETSEIFRKDKTLFSADRFHPNERGYAVWTKVINPALDEALASQTSHCKVD